MSIQQRINELKQSLPEEVALVAVSKTFPAEDILEAMETGHLDFGENRVQELVAKYEVLPKSIRWHQIGHLQSNKVKYIAPFVHLIHAVDSEKLLEEINKQAKKNKRVIQVLLQIHIAQEEEKFGFDYEVAEQLLTNGTLAKYPHVKVIGLMGMASFTQDKLKVRSEFNKLKNFFTHLQKILPHFNTLSMGMSGDYIIAIEEGSTMIRVGSALFGKR